MTNDPLTLAFGRLDRALGTLEQRLSGAFSAPPVAFQDTSPDERYDRLEERHRVLRERTVTAVDRLTRLLDPALADAAVAPTGEA